VTEVTIYRLTCKPTGESYVGSTTQAWSRRRGHHLSRLRADWHRSRRLQAAWRKFGEAAFTFEIVEVVESWERGVAEQRAINSSRSTFNALTSRGLRR
jgi:predicted GIY-YIG superfamily endonuclease